ncbi:hypothetical protein BDY21DRAFT_363647, partial [Lineolata rhizophorae]
PRRNGCGEDISPARPSGVSLAPRFTYPEQANCGIEFNEAIRKLRKLGPKPQKPSSQRLAECLERKFTEVRMIVPELPEDAVGQPPAKEEDYRLLDILVFEGGAHNELRRAFAQLSLAAGFNQSNPRLLRAMLYTKSLKLPKDSQGSIRAYVRVNFHPKSQTTARAAVSTGLKLFAIGMAYSSHVMPILLAFVQRHIMSMEFSDVMAAFELPALSKAKEFATSLSSWMDTAWECYNAQGMSHAMHISSGPTFALLSPNNNANPILSETRPQKRRRTSPLAITGTGASGSAEIASKIRQNEDVHVNPEVDSTRGNDTTWSDRLENRAAGNTTEAIDADTSALTMDASSGTPSSDVAVWTPRTIQPIAGRRPNRQLIGRGISGPARNSLHRLPELDSAEGQRGSAVQVKSEARESARGGVSELRQGHVRFSPRTADLTQGSGGWNHVDGREKENVTKGTDKGVNSRLEHGDGAAATQQSPQDFPVAPNPHSSTYQTHADSPPLLGTQLHGESSGQLPGERRSPTSRLSDILHYEDDSSWWRDLWGQI